MARSGGPRAVPQVRALSSAPATPMTTTSEPLLHPVEAPPPSAEQLRKLEQLRARIAELDGGALVAFSGGVDSAFLLAVAHQVLGERCVALTAVSPSLHAREREACSEIARELGVRLVMRDTFELDDPNYVANPSNRCFFCKSALFDMAERVREELGLPHVLLGTNVDDLGDFRPGLAAARERKGLSPMVDAGLRKADVRALARHLGLSVWDKPAMACLSSRFPYGTRIDRERLDRIAACEDLLHELGFRGSRARFHDKVVRLELRVEDLPRALEPGVRERLVEGCKALGFLWVALDLEGYRTGSLNAALER